MATNTSRQGSSRVPVPRRAHPQTCTGGDFGACRGQKSLQRSAALYYSFLLRNHRCLGFRSLEIRRFLMVRLNRIFTALPMLDFITGRHFASLWLNCASVRSKMEHRSAIHWSSCACVHVPFLPRRDYFRAASSRLRKTSKIQVGLKSLLHINVYVYNLLTSYPRMMNQIFFVETCKTNL